MATSNNPSSGSDSLTTTNVERQLEEAIRNNNYDEVKILLDANNDLLEVQLQHEFHEDGSMKTLCVSPLILATALSHDSIVKLLLDYNARADAEVPELGGTALHIAARYSPRHTVDLLLSKDVDKNKQNQAGSSPLHLASEYNQLEVVRCLLDAQADLSQRDNDGCTPFHIASLFGREEILRLLWDRGPSEQIHQLNKYLNGPLHLACFCEHDTVVELLLNWGAKVDQPGPNGATPLFHACKNGNSAIINMLANRGADIHAKNDDGDTPILYSCWHSQPSSLETLKKHSASVLDVNKEGNNCFHMVVSKQNPSGDSIDVLDSLLGYGAKINHVNHNGHSPLYIACLEQNFKHSKHLLDKGADINQQSTLTRGTALMEACCKPNTEIVEMLLQRGADTTLTNNHGLTALALACMDNNLENVKALIRNGATVSVHDREGHTPLWTAVINQNFDIALEILATPAYFPPSPAKERAFTERSTSKEDARRIEDEFLQSFENSAYDDGQLQKILHWAVSNGALELARRCISHRPQVLQLELRGKATWLHIAAQYGEHEFIRHLQSVASDSETAVERSCSHEINVLAEAEGKITALHAAAVNGDLKTAQLLLQMLPDQLQRAEAIIRRNNQGESPLNISIKKKHETQETLFWDEIRKLRTTNSTLMTSDPVPGSRILESLAKYEIPGHEVVLEELLQKCFGDGHVEERLDFTTLHWAVYRSQAVVVWWLLSKGGYSSGDTIENALQLVSDDKHTDANVQHHIRQLLLHPPPILDQVANPDNKRITSKPTRMDEENPVLDLQGNIVDIYTTGKGVSIPYTKASIRDIIYRHGPELLMKKPKENWAEHDLDELKRKLEQTTHETLNSYPLGSGISVSAGSGIDNNEESGTVGALKLRWIHLPVNDLHLMRDLVFRLSHDSNRFEVDHTVLMQYFNRSWTELAAGGKQNYMKPRCVRKEKDPANEPDNGPNRSQSPGEFISCTALYMPYLTWGFYSKRDGVNLSRGSEESDATRTSRQIKHQPMTLDQYYYPTIADTHERDEDQVLSRFLHEESIPNTREILMVNQLWMWIIDEKTIITATAENFNQQHKEDLFEETLHKILYGQTTNHVDHAVSAQSVMELILGVATGLFMKKSIAIPRRSTKKGPIEIFRESIRNVANKETKLFREFSEGLQHEKTRQKESRHDYPQRNKEREEEVPPNRYHIISSETELLDTTRDIRDELHILKYLAEDQNIVWNQAFSQKSQEDRFQYHHPSLPDDVKKDLDDMLLEAQQTTDYINTLLGLRQAEYSRIQASEAARLSNDLARQSNSILIFTIVTIVFLPLSFLSSLFALDVTDFPHDESGNLKYQGWWLFPILFGVTLVVSTPTIALAWNVNAILGWFRLGTRHDSPERALLGTDLREEVLARLRPSRHSVGTLTWRPPRHSKDDVEKGQEETYESSHS